MKKVFQSSKWKKHSRKVSERELYRKQKRHAFLKAKNIRFTQKHQKRNISTSIKVTHQKHHNRFEVTVPTKFSIINNPNEMLEFYDTIYSYAKKNQAVYLEMSGIEYISADAILYTISIFDYLEHALRYQKLSGNFPKNERTKDLLLQSSFFNYVHANFWFNPDNSKILSVKSGNLAQGIIAKQVIDFSKSILNKRSSIQSKSIYGTIIECMVNTRHHAYRHMVDHQWKWWLMAMPNEKGDSIQFAFLDNGAGIPTTVRKNFAEKVTAMFGQNSKDSNLIQSALQGQYRTRMKDKWRGKGLPKIFEYFNDNYIDNLHIISNKGHVDCKNEVLDELNKKFHGTLLSWDFV
jgi:hypothetical protein